MRPLAEALAENTSAVSLNLSCNRIEAVGAEYLAEALATNCTLTSLNLRGNNIGPKGAGHLAMALERNSGLKTLNLGGNGIGGAGAASIAAALRTNSSVESIVLSNNAIGRKGVQQLTEAVEANGTTQFLDIRGLNVPTAEVEEQTLESVAAVLEGRRPRMVLTVACSAGGRVTCTTLAGRVLEAQGAVGDTLSELLGMLSAHLGLAEDRLQLVLQDGALLRATEGQATLGELLGCGPGVPEPAPRPAVEAPARVCRAEAHGISTQGSEAHGIGTQGLEAHGIGTQGSHSGGPHALHGGTPRLVVQKGMLGCLQSSMVGFCRPLARC